MFDILRDAEVTVFDLANDVEGGVMAGSSTASAGVIIGTTLGFTKVDFFGCESSFEDRSHAYQNEEMEELIWVEVDGKEYKHAPTSTYRLKR